MYYKDETKLKLTEQQSVEITLTELKRRAKMLLLESSSKQSYDQDDVTILQSYLNVIESLQTDEQNAIWDVEIDAYSKRLSALNQLSAISQELGLYD